MKSTRYQNQKRAIALKLGFFLAGAIILILLADSCVRPVIQSIASYHARVFAMKCINDAMAGELARENIAYDDLVSVTLNAAGDVTSIQSKMMTVNYLKVHLTDTIIKELQNKGRQTLKIPAGTLLGNQFTSGRGPLVEIKITPIGYVQTGISNKFISAGINQTLHQIMLETKIEMSVIIPGYSIKTEIITNYCLAETVIVGNVPDGYTNITGDDSSLISKVNDYLAEP